MRLLARMDLDSAPVCVLSLTHTLTRSHSVRKIEDVEATLDQIRDQVEDHEEVSLAMSEGIGQDAFIDEGELEDELANLEMEGLDEQMNQLSMPATPTSAPSGGKGKAPAAKGGKVKSEADELRELEAAMAL